MKIVMALRPPYSQIAILDPTTKVEVPLWKKGVPFVATDTCILCGCLAEMDGETEFTLATSDSVSIQHPPIFDDVLDTPGRKIALETVEGTPVLDMPTTGTKTRVRIWTNSDREPDKVVVGID
jgi:hypothetical protein